MLGEECGEPGARDVRYDQGWDLLTAQGRLGELAGTLPEMFPDPESAQARGTRALVLLAAGARDEAAEVVAPLLDRGPGHPATISGCSAWPTRPRSPPRSARPRRGLYAALLPFADQAVVSGAAITFKGAVAHYLGVLAAARGRAATAAATWSRPCGARAARRGGLDPAQPVRAGPGAAGPAGAARGGGVRAGGGGRRRARSAWPSWPGTPRRPGSRPGRPGHQGVFARDGAVWTLAYGGVTVRMRDAKGLADLAALLAVPGREVAAADLSRRQARAGPAADLRLGADEVFDAAARRQIRARLAELAEDIAEAESWNDPERAARARAERDAVLGQVTAAAAPGGQPACSATSPNARARR